MMQYLFDSTAAEQRPEYLRTFQGDFFTLGIGRIALCDIGREKSIQRFLDQVRERTKRRVPLKTPELIANLNPVIRGWGNYYQRAHVRKLFHRLDGWIVHRIRSHRYKRWRNGGWRQLPETKLFGELGLVNLVRRIPSLASRKSESS